MGKKKQTLERLGGSLYMTYGLSLRHTETSMSTYMGWIQEHGHRQLLVYYQAGIPDVRPEGIVVVGMQDHKIKRHPHDRGALLFSPPGKETEADFYVQINNRTHGQIVKAVGEILTTCAKAWLESELGYAPHCLQCPYQLACIAKQQTGVVS